MTFHVSFTLPRRYSVVHLEPGSHPLAGNHRLHRGLFLCDWPAATTLPTRTARYLAPDRVLSARLPHTGGRARLATRFHWRSLPLQRAHDPTHAAGRRRAAALAARDTWL